LTPSEISRKASEAVEKVVELLEGEIMIEIESRIDQAVATFTYNQSAPFSHKHFNQTIAAFVRHIYEHGLLLAQKLTPSQAMTEAISILEQNYGNVFDRGYEEALLDASIPELNGLAEILDFIGGAIKARERQNQVNWIIAAHLESLDWQVRRQATELLIEKYRVFLGDPRMLQYPPSRFADNLASLLNTELTSDSSLQKILDDPSFY